MTLKRLYKEIISLKNLKPSPQVNGLFEALVKKALDECDHETLTLQERKNLNCVCSLAEYELEKYWSEKVISGEAHIEEFPYFSNYKALARLEWHALQACSRHSDHKGLFVGGGPLPLTAIIFAQEYGIPMAVIDNDVRAVKLARAVVKRIGLERQIKILRGEAELFTKYKNYNLIVVAALAGSTKTKKENIFLWIKKNAAPGTHIIGRSSWGRRRLLYPEIPRSVYRIFEPIMRIHPHNDIVNSIVLLRQQE